jgi:hypothetical protein
MRLRLPMKKYLLVLNVRAKAAFDVPGLFELGYLLELIEGDIARFPPLF